VFVEIEKHKGNSDTSDRLTAVLKIFVFCTLLVSSRQLFYHW
jgi:hypothetical protein